MSGSLHHFIGVNRQQVIDRVRHRSNSTLSEAIFERGIPVFLTQLTDALRPQGPLTLRQHHVVLAEASRAISDSAALHGVALQKHGSTVGQVVHGYGDVCQAVTELASEAHALISPEDFHTFNGCLDAAIAAAVASFGRQRESEVAREGTTRLGVLAHELRNLLGTAVLSFDIIRKGLIGLGGSTGAMHARSLTGLRSLVDAALVDIRLETGLSAVRRISLASFIEDMEVDASMQAQAYARQLKVNAVDAEVTIDADRQLLASALSNLLQNAFKFTHAAGRVSLSAYVEADRVLIDVADECGGLPTGSADALFKPFAQESSDRSGLGLGLSIALDAVRANSGTIRVRDIPGSGCVFTIDLPLPIPQVLPTRAGGRASF
jgi:hypothetical protein